MITPLIIAAIENPPMNIPIVGPTFDEDIAEGDLSLITSMLCPSITNKVFFRSAINSAMIYDAVIDPSSVA